jgi:hypothetical protein
MLQLTYVINQGNANQHSTLYLTATIQGEYIE